MLLGLADGNQPRREETVQDLSHMTSQNFDRELLRGNTTHPSLFLACFLPPTLLERRAELWQNLFEYRLNI